MRFAKAAISVTILTIESRQKQNSLNNVERAPMNHKKVPDQPGPHYIKFANRRLSRREMLRLSAGSLLAMGLWPGACLEAAEQAGPGFSFIAVNDFHYIDQRCGKWLAETVLPRMQACSPKPEFCLVSGDLTDNGKQEQFAAVREILNGLGFPAYVVIGNHDYLPPKDRTPYEEIFPGRLNYFIEHRGWLLVGLDTTEATKATNTKIPNTTFQWLDEQLPKLDKKRPMILFTHFPLGANVKNRPTNADALLERFLEFNLQAAFCGHYHAFTEATWQNAILTTDRCCSLQRFNHDKTKEKGFFFCNVKDGKITREFVEVPVPEEFKNPKQNK